MLHVAICQFQVEILKEACERDLSSALNAIKLKPLGVFVQVREPVHVFLETIAFAHFTFQASTLGSLEALLEFLKTSKIP